jgi:hypothetical protein
MATLRCGIREAGSRFNALSLDGAVDRRSTDAEEFGHLEGAVLATVDQGDEVGFLTAVELGLFPAQPALGLGDLHAFPGPEPNEVGLELSNHGKNVEQQSSDRVGGVVDRPAQAQADLPGGELVGDRAGIRQRPGQSVELGHHQGVPGSTCGQGLAEPGTFAVGAGQAVVDVDSFSLDAEAEQGVALRGEVLLIGGASGVPDKQRALNAPPELGSVVPRDADDSSIGAAPDPTSGRLRSRYRNASSGRVWIGLHDIASVTTCGIIVA